MRGEKKNEEVFIPVICFDDTTYELGSRSGKYRLSSLK